MFIFTTKTIIQGYIYSRTIQLAVDRLYRDMHMVLQDGETMDENVIHFEIVQGMEEEGFVIEVQQEQILVEAADDLGLVYAFLEISKEFLGIPPLWFWQELTFEQAESVPVEEQKRFSKKKLIHYRGWFFNDETFLARWNPKGDERLAWEMGFEACLRCGGNMVIPGDIDNYRKYGRMASEMGLILTHHHVETLGAPMFLNVYPDKEPSYIKNKELFEQIWENAVKEQADQKTIYAVGFRGQGDCAFWESESNGAELTDKEKGKFICDIMKRQIEIIRKYVKNPIICTNLYGEIMELYREGCLDIPDEVIKIWADNGYGKMVARRRGNHNPRTIALPLNEQEREGKHGIYYHVSFYDLQAASHTTMMPQTPEYFDKQLWEAFHDHLTEYLIVNCSSVRQHTCTLEMVAKIWSGEHITSETFYPQFVQEYYGKRNTEICALYEKYPSICIRYGEQEDETAGEQFYTHSVRVLAAQWMISEKHPAEDMKWATDAETMDGQIKWVYDRCEAKEKEFLEYVRECQGAGGILYDSLTVQAILHYEGCAGTNHFCRAWEEWKKQDYMEAFYECGLAAEHFSIADRALRESEKGIWKDFYKYERFADYKFAAHILRCLMAYIRIYSDGNWYYKWDAKLRKLCGKGEIFCNWDNHETEKELFERMKKIRGETFDAGLIVWNRV